ncbi:ABC transporter substrate-binding protein [Streptomonospora litoralis]|uniref:ABC transporter periplasmic-binding protein YtfQ n=1 Tax=Streptomonospora litoralis TaxID=2498135 RepID=A0A4P6QA89_9ACTN|nr:ABC transporter substrate-binding protein [Streptomonospora litoralis]QBI56314.1 ABC transporter periplasmic-binding protein YtfQ precursor [Streptomonospora litoralis]
MAIDLLDRAGRSRRRTATVFTAVTCTALTLLASSCARSEDDVAADQPSGDASARAQQLDEAAGSDQTCNIEQFGMEKFDLQDMTVGFSQSEAESNPFRITETASIEDEAKKRGVELITANAQSDFAQQISDVQGLMSQGAELLIIAPLNSDGWEPVLAEAERKQVPIVTIDREINGNPCEDYVTFIGSDFVEQGRRAADQMIEALGGEGKVAILLGTPGNNVTTERTKGFKDRVEEKAPGIEVVFEQTGEFTRQGGQSVTEQLIQSNPDIDGVYAENDEMGIGAVTALRGAGKQPGDVKIVTVDGTKTAVQNIIDGWIYAVVESNPRFGPLAFDAHESFGKGEDVPVELIISDRVYTQENAEEQLPNAY